MLLGDSQRQSLGLIRADGRYSNLALLLSDQCPHSIKATIFQGITKESIKDRKEFTDSVFKQIDEVLAYLNVYNKVASTFEGAYTLLARMVERGLITNKRNGKEMYYAVSEHSEGN